MAIGSSVVRKFLMKLEPEHRNDSSGNGGIIPGQVSAYREATGLLFHDCAQCGDSMSPSGIRLRGRQLGVHFVDGKVAKCKAARRNQLGRLIRTLGPVSIILSLSVESKGLNLLIYGSGFYSRVAINVDKNHTKTFAVSAVSRIVLQNTLLSLAQGLLKNESCYCV